MNWGTQKESSNIGFIGALSAGRSICEDFAILDAGRQREENKKEKHTVYPFLPSYKTPSGSKTKVLFLNVRRDPGGAFVKKTRVL